MISQDDINKIRDLKSRRYSQGKVAQELGVSRSTVARYWGDSGKRLKLENLFQMGECRNCGLIYPKPKFLASWTCPLCKNVYSWKKCWYIDTDGQT
jgi:transcriptional regulator with XRE-family HTH domain